MKNIEIYVGVVIMALFLVLSFFLRDVITCGLIIAFSIVIGTLILRKLSNQ